MWLITPFGFFSIVQKPGDASAGTLTVRARVRADLVALAQHGLPGLGTIEESTDTDYRFRAQAPRAQVAAALAAMAEAIDYDNFKDEVAQRQGHARSKLYGKVWSVLHALQTDPAFVRKTPRADSCGGVVVSGGNRVLLREPRDRHAGYAWTFAKTRRRPGESKQETALRAVREKTGYTATVRLGLHGVFAGSASRTHYYLMDAGHPPADPGGQTASVRWARFDEARALIGLTVNAEGRARDLAILGAAEAALPAIAWHEHARVQPQDWNDLQEMPARHAVLRAPLRYSADEMRRIRRGFFPTQMEQKWFLVCTGERLRMHRSWTGCLIFDVGFAPEADGGARVSEVLVNRDPQQYTCTDDAEDLQLVERIIRGHLLEPLAGPAVDPFAQGLLLAAQPDYLGSPQVVSALIGELFDTAVQVIRGEATVQALQAAASKVLAAFTRDDAGYTRMPGWHSAQQLGVHVAKYLLTPPEVGEDDTLETLLAQGLSGLLSKLREMLAAFLRDENANWEADALVQLKALQCFAVAVLLGTNTLSHGERTLGDFHWVPAVNARDAG